jgi:hypothetical protein
MQRDNPIQDAYVTLKLELAKDMKADGIDYLMNKFRLRENRKATVKHASPGTRGLKLLNELGILGKINKRNVEDLIESLRDCWANPDDMEELICDFDQFRDGHRPEIKKKETPTRTTTTTTTKTKTESMGTEESTQNCVVCMDADRGTTLVPCGHYCLCIDCASDVDTCPMCRSHIDNVVRTYSS